MTDDDSAPEVTAKKPYPLRPKRPPASRDDVLRRLKDDELSFGEILDAVDGGLLTPDEGAAVLPGVYDEKAMSDLKEQQAKWSRDMQQVADIFRQPPAAVAAIQVPDEQQVAATREVRIELAGMADILRTTGEQIVSMVRLAGSTVTNLELVHHETVSLRKSSERLERWTKWLVRLTILVAILTVVIVGRDLMR